MDSLKYLYCLIDRNGSKANYSQLLPLEDELYFLAQCEALAPIFTQRYPDSNLVAYRSNNPVDSQRGGTALVRREAVKLLKGNEVSTRPFRQGSTTASYLGMARWIITIDIDNVSLGNLQIDALKGLEYTTTATGVHLHVPAPQLKDTLKALKHLENHIDKYGHDVLSPITGTMKDGVKIRSGVL